MSHVEPTTAGLEFRIADGNRQLLTEAEAWDNAGDDGDDYYDDDGA